MLLTAAKSLALQALVIISIIATVSLTVRSLEGPAAAHELLDLSLRRLLGIWVWTLGWGLASFVRAEAMAFANDLNSILRPSAPVAEMIGRVENSVSHGSALPVTAPVTTVGLGLTLLYGVPLPGLGKYAVILGITAIYYVAAFLLWHFVSVIRGLDCLFKGLDEVRFRTSPNPLHLENALTYLSLTTTIGVLSIYVGFRGTLTADFLFPYDSLRPLLITPLVLFLPVTLLYNYYPRYVLRRLVQHRMFATITALTVSKSKDIQALMMEIKELGFTNAQVLPFIDYKSLPSYIISILFVLSLAYHNDPAVKAFVGYLLGLEP